MIKTVIIDDKEKARLTIKGILSENCENIQLVGEANSVEKGAELIESLKPDLVILDIEMPDGTGFNLINQLEYSEFKLIFITGHSDYAIKAIKVDAVDYILKPINPYELIAAIEKVSKTILNVPSNKAFDNKTICLKTAQKDYYVKINEIIRFESDRNYTKVILKDKKLLLSKTLLFFENQLDDCNFIRVHKSHLVNFSKIKGTEKINGFSIVMTDNAVIPVSRKMRPELTAKLKKSSINIA